MTFISMNYYYCGTASSARAGLRVCDRDTDRDGIITAIDEHVSGTATGRGRTYDSV